MFYTTACRERYGEADRDPVASYACLLSVRALVPAVASQTRAVRSSLAVTTRAPSGLNDAERTSPVCPLSVRATAPVRASQTRAVPSELAVTTRAPSGLNDAERAAARTLSVRATAPF